MWKLYFKLGNLADVYVAGRRDVSGSFFGFIKFSNVERPEKIEAELSNISCRGRKLTANLSRHPRLVKRNGVFKPLRPSVRQPISVGQQRDSRTFAEVARGNRNPADAPNNHIITLSCI